MTPEDRKREYNRKRYYEKREQILEQKKEYQKNNREKINETKRAYWYKNRPKLLEKQNKYWHANKDKIACKRKKSRDSKRTMSGQRRWWERVDEAIDVYKIVRFHAAKRRLDKLNRKADYRNLTRYYELFKRNN